MNIKDYRKLIPGNCPIIIAGEEQLTDWGALNLKALKRLWRQEEATLRHIGKMIPADRKYLQTVRESIQILDRLIAELPVKPVFPTLRAVSHFVPDAKVIFFEEKRWIEGKIYRTPTKLGSPFLLQADERIDDNGFLDGRGLSFWLEDPCVLLKWELDFLSNNPGYASLWAVNTACHAETPIDLYRALNVVAEV